MYFGKVEGYISLATKEDRLDSNRPENYNGQNNTNPYFINPIYYTSSEKWYHLNTSGSRFVSKIQSLKGVARDPGFRHFQALNRPPIGIVQNTSPKFSTSNTIIAAPIPSKYTIYNKYFDSNNKLHNYIREIYKSS